MLKNKERSPRKEKKKQKKPKLTMDIRKMAEWNKAWKELEMAKLDQQGRHRSQWIYSPFDGRKKLPNPNGT